MRSISITILITAFLLGTAGCSSLNLSKVKWKPLAGMNDQQDSADAIEPASLAVIWKDSVYEKPGTPSVKGFGGRVFINDASGKPVRTEGELIVYGYDESNPSQSHAGADKKFVFPREQFQRHYSENDLGPSYSVWVPWEKVGGLRKSITLIPVFKTASGKVLRGDQSINVLPGKKPQSNESISEVTQANGHSNSPNVIAQASFEKPTQTTNGIVEKPAADAGSVPRQRLRTTTLNLPRSLAKKLAASQSQANAKTAGQKNVTIDQATSRPDAAPTEPKVLTPLTAPKTEATKSDATKPRIFGVPGSF